jgi:hypothetical protein
MNSFPRMYGFRWGHWGMMHLTGSLNGLLTLILDDNMAHKWEWSDGGPDAHPLGGPYRKCAHCGIIQQRFNKTEWMRTVGYYWWPLAGRCKADKKPKPTKS